MALAAGMMVAAPAHAGWFWDRGYEDVDPYAYEYRPPGYYPYYNSGYWRPAEEMRKPRPYYVQPPYYPAWGYPLGCAEDCVEDEGYLK